MLVRREKTPRGFEELTAGESEGKKESQARRHERHKSRAGSVHPIDFTEE